MDQIIKMNTEKMLRWDTKCFFVNMMNPFVSISDLGFVLLVAALFIALATVWANIAYR